MEDIVLEASLRQETGKSKIKPLRKSGFIPAIVYGEGKKTVSIKVERRSVLRLIHEHHIENVIINLKIAGDEKKAKDSAVIIKEIQRDPVRDDILHIDFHQISLTKEIKVKVPIIAKGEPVGVKVDGGSLEHVIWELEIECLPTQIPPKIEVEVSQLKIGDSILVKDLTLPPGIKVLQEPDQVVVSVAAPVKEEVALTPEEGAAPEEPEVIKEKKEVPEEGAAKEEKPEKKEEKEAKKEEKKS
ncbi:MAG: 50S ribosomal protein L25/general stress protein Ctc [Candidatus Omnitrophica bacterium]|nr:50S ribosomal protein L25/general stress protein Ctc [Candidatus Omnitrophota bacterium]